MINLRREECMEWLEDYNECLHREKEVRCTCACAGWGSVLLLGWTAHQVHSVHLLLHSAPGGRSLSGSGSGSSRAGARRQEVTTECGWVACSCAGAVLVLVEMLR